MKKTSKIRWISVCLCIACISFASQAAADITDKNALFQKLDSISGSEGKFDAVEELSQEGPSIVPLLMDYLRLPGTGRDEGSWVAVEILVRHWRVAFPGVCDSVMDRQYEFSWSSQNIDPELTPYIKGYLKHEDVMIRSCAVVTLGLMRANARDAIPELVQALKDSDAGVREKAAAALGNMRPYIPNFCMISVMPTQQQVREAWDAEEEDTEIVETLRQTAVPKLIDLLRDPEPRVRLSAVEALLNIQSGTEQTPNAEWYSTCYGAPEVPLNVQSGTEQALNTLRDLLRHDDPQIVLSALSIMGRFGPAAAPAFPDLMSMLQNTSDESLIGALAGVFKSIGPGAREAAPLLFSLLDKGDGKYLWVIDILGAIGAVDEIIRAAQSENPRIRGFALREMPRIRANADQFIPVLLQLLKDEDSEIRWEALSTIHSLRVMDEEILNCVMPLLADDKKKVRFEAIVVLIEFDVAGEETAAALLELLSSKNPKTRERVAILIRDNLRWSKNKTAIQIVEKSLQDEALGKLYRDALPSEVPYHSDYDYSDKSISELIELLASSDGNAQQNAAYELGERGSAAAEAIPALVNAMRKKHVYRLEESAAEALGKIGPEAVPYLLDALKEDNPRLRANVMLAFGFIQPVDPKVVRAINIILSDTQESFEARDNAGKAIYTLGPGAAGAVPALIQMLHDEEWRLRGRAAGALAAIGPDAAASTPDLIQALQDEKRYVREKALAALTSIGPLPREAVLPILEITERDSTTDSIMYFRAWAPGNGFGPDLIPELIAALKNPNATVRKNAAEALRNFGQEAKQAAPALVEIIENDDDSQARKEAALTLCFVAPENAAPAIPILKEMLESNDPSEESLALFAIGKLGYLAKDMVPSLIEFLELHPDTNGIFEVFISIGAMEEAAAHAVSGLIARLEDIRPDVRRNAAHTLSRIGPAAGSALPALENARNDVDAGVREQVTLAIQMISKNNNQ